MKRLPSLFRIALALAAVAHFGLAGRLPAAAGEPVPFRGHADEVVTGAEPIGPGLVLLTVVASGEATHLGRFTGIETVVLDLADGTFAGTRVFVAANGDRLYADVAGGFTSPTTAEGTFTFTGGTGRFRDATGGADFEVVSPDGIHIALTLEGTIEF
jgi:hypothetical protein